MSEISAKVIAGHIHPDSGTKITTFELEMPRIILAEFNTHRAFSRNTSSSRAIPSSFTASLLETNNFVPEHIGKNKSGMQASEYFEGQEKEDIQSIWREATESAVAFSKKLAEKGVHKQLANRVTEAYQNIKTVCTATELNNFFWLRDDDAAQPEIHELAQKMWKAYNEYTFTPLGYQSWHVPYYMEGEWVEDEDGVDKYGNTLSNALKISASVCAQVSYRKGDASLEKAEKLWTIFFGGERVHASVSEHQAKPIYDYGVQSLDQLWESGGTHVDLNGDVWSGNFKHWIQHRQLIKNNYKAG